MNANIRSHKIQKRSRRRGLFPWRPRFPSRATGDWDEWYRDWIMTRKSTNTKREDNA